MAGMSRDTGAALGGFDHLRQSIADILTTPLGTRVHRRDYGSRIMGLVDRPINQSLVADMVAAAAEALDRWEPRLKVERLTIDSVTAEGQITLSLDGYYLVNGQRVTFEGLVL
jgi:phage baseplate assembly protein W